MKKTFIENYEKNSKKMIINFIRRLLKQKKIYENDYHIVGKGLDLVIIQDFYTFTLSEIFIILKYDIPMKIVKEWHYLKNENFSDVDYTKTIFEFFEEKTIPKEKREERRKKELEESEQKVHSSLRDLYTILGASEEVIQEAIKNLKK